MACYDRFSGLCWRHIALAVIDCILIVASQHLYLKYRSRCWFLSFSFLVVFLFLSFYFFAGFMSVLVVCCLFIQPVCLCSRGNACLFWRQLEGEFNGRWFVAVVGSDPENWLKGHREDREGSRTAYLVFWQVWLILSRLCLPQLGVGTPWWGKVSGMVCGFYRSHGWRVGEPVAGVVVLC